MIISYTDKEQSKKLAEILPIESADMFYRDNGIDVKLIWEHIAQKVTNPCWSVAALLDLLPPYLYEFDRGIDLNIYRNLNGKGWHCSYMPNCIENMKKDKFKLITNGDNLVDACYKMILELKERSLI